MKYILLGHHQGRPYYYGDAGDDLLVGGSDDDWMFGDGYSGQGNDTLIGNEGDDHLDGGEGDDLIYGGSDQDRISGGKGQDSLYGGQGNDNLRGDEGDDLIHGDSGRDHVDGGEGKDSLYGGQGNDFYSGGDDQERDIYFIAKEKELDISDYIWEFTNHDQLDLTAIGAIDRMSFDGGDITLFYGNTRHRLSYQSTSNTLEFSNLSLHTHFVFDDERILPNQAPTAIDDVIYMAVAPIISLDPALFLQNDIDPEQRALYLLDIENGSQGVFLLGSSILLSSDGGTTLRFSFSYLIEDNYGLTSSANVTVHMVDETVINGIVTRQINLGAGAEHISITKQDQHALSEDVLVNFDPLEDHLSLDDAFGIADLSSLLIEQRGNDAVIHLTPNQNIIFQDTDASFLSNHFSGNGGGGGEPQNQAPVVASPIGNQLFVQGQAFSVSFAALFSDADNDVLTYQLLSHGATVLPTWLQFDAEAQTISGVMENIGRTGINVTIRANDGQADTDYLFNISSRIEGTEHSEYLVLSSLDEAVNGLAGHDTIDGQDGDDLINGGVGNDSLIGGNGNDTIYGDDGDDTLTAGIGSDQLFGGAGSDVYRFTDIASASVQSHNTIMDFNYQQDRIDVSQLGYSGIQQGAAFGTILGWETRAGNTVITSSDGFFSIELDNHTAPITANQFVFHTIADQVLHDLEGQGIEGARVVSDRILLDLELPRLSAYIMLEPTSQAHHDGALTMIDNRTHQLRLC